ncbi:hypothetical protein M430DRAFT_60994 [Amorphotheca resinae ATCC 22711]|uniref:Uncharacterized protein n=1 Tax=Amorphotheca resinae ATCC 22711 TaxID=857342 RepID=A0A2T3AST5_AMORE|nr:hypothetical protein M430DRAFT_60994 [Amorphotheca resinae ATCC 22711]PSS10558.1 hypothetical protein M430DRAFT_60994 [Amorphotheca resinae ATCC 22711]
MVRRKRHSALSPFHSPSNRPELGVVGPRSPHGRARGRDGAESGSDNVDSCSRSRSSSTTISSSPVLAYRSRPTGSPSRCQGQTVAGARCWTGKGSAPGRYGTNRWIGGSMDRWMSGGTNPCGWNPSRGLPLFACFVGMVGVPEGSLLDLSRIPDRAGEG